MSHRYFPPPKCVGHQCWCITCISLTLHTHTHKRVGFPAFHSCRDCKVTNPQLIPVPILLLGEQGLQHLRRQTHFVFTQPGIWSQNISVVRQCANHYTAEPHTMTNSPHLPWLFSIPLTYYKIKMIQNVYVCVYLVVVYRATAIFVWFCLRICVCVYCWLTF